MELTPRKKAVLAAIVKAYIETGEPVGSKILSELIENAPSTATLRNEMNELCSLGYLSQPHTSAGRVPTSSGYRMYIESLMKPSLLEDRTKRYIDGFMSMNEISAEDIPKAAAQSLSDLTGFPALFSYSADNKVTFRQVQLLTVGRKSAVILAVTSDGRTLSRMCRLAFEPSSDLVTGFQRIFADKLKSKPLIEFQPAFLQNIVMSLGVNSLDMLPLFTELFKMAYTAARPTVALSGASRLYNISSGDNARRIMSLVSNADLFLPVIEGITDDKKVIFGNDTLFPELSDMTVVAVSYGCKNRVCGKIGIIGPDRMSYERIIPSIEYAAQEVSKLMTEAAKDMED